jgi:hypothetical protein
MTSQNIDLSSRSGAGAKDNTGRPSQTTKMALSRKPFVIGHMFIKSFLLRMTDTMTSQNIDLSSRSGAGAKDNTGRPSQTTKVALSQKPFGIGHMFI